MNEVVDTLKTHNLSTFFVLPLLGINKEKFEGFLNCYISKNSKYCFMQFSSPVQKKIPYVMETINRSDGVYYKLEIPLEWKEDIMRFQKGEYSKFSYVAKQRIFNHSGLAYKEVLDTTVVTDIRLLGLTKSPAVLQFWNKLLYDNESESPLTEEDELLSKPSEKDYIEFKGISV